jgi:beta-galactosidase
VSGGGAIVDAGPPAGGAGGQGGGATGGSGPAGGTAKSGGTQANGGTVAVGGTIMDAGAGGITVDSGAGGITVDAGAGGITVDAGAGGVTVDGGAGGITVDAGAGGITVDAGSTGGGGGANPPVPIAGRVRNIMPLDRTWLFNKGDAAGADAATFPDSTWTKVNVPHDWSIEGPFDQNATTTGRGGYLPAGIGWYRNHFTLPTTVAAGQQVYIEFDGVMGDSTVYINGTKLGEHPYGYVSFRYDMTKGIKFTGENVISVKSDTSVQPASRFYAGSGIFRHVRILATDPVHIDQWATFVTTPSPTTTAATVKVSTSVVNSGTTSQSVAVQGNVTDPSGTALAPVTTPAQTIAAGASASFSFDVPVSNPKLWSPDSPSMYQLVTTVQVGGKAVDDDLTPFGIRSLVYDGTIGLSINGKSTKFQGVCLHQDYHGLGMAAPQRAMQRRLAQLKLYGVNAIRTAHDPPSPDFLELCDRMGVLVMDEFFDVWTAQKYADKGDYARFFNQTATSPTGMPAVPGATTGTKWYEVDVTGVVMRDRNHPSVALYSVGNEIRDSNATRLPILTRMASIIHTIHPGSSLTQALFRPADGNDVTGPTRAFYDVFGGNYRTNEVIDGMKGTPAKAGLFTEMGTELTTWDLVTSTPGLTGEFMWTGVDYLGESDGGWPRVGGNGALLDELGTPRDIAFSWQSTWGAPKTTFSTGVVAGKVVLTPDHDKITTDLNDVSFVKAAVPTATAPVTFSITGPGTIIAVDSGSNTQESFRGDTRNAFGNLAFAIVQATGPGSITVTAKSAGLTDGTATITATDGPFIPCSGTCD